MTVQLILAVLMAFGAGVLFARGWKGRRARKAGRKSDVLVVVYTRVGLRSFLGREEAGNILSPEDVPYPMASMMQVDLPGKRGRLYHFAADEVELSKHDALEQARASVNLRQIFAGGGQWLSALQAASLVLPLLVMISVWMTISGLSQQLGEVLVVLDVLRDLVRTP